MTSKFGTNDDPLKMNKLSNPGPHGAADILYIMQHFYGKPWRTERGNIYAIRDFIATGKELPYYMADQARIITALSKGVQEWTL